MSSQTSSSQASVPSISPQQQAKSRRTIVLVFLTCFLPIVAAAYFYFVDRPEVTNNYGTLINPQLDAPATEFQNINGKPFKVTDYKGKWVLVQVIHSSCDEVCQQAMFYQRQARKTKGQDMYRIERIAFVTDDGPLETQLLRQFDDVHFVRAKPEQLQAWLPLQGGIVGRKGTSNVGGLHDHIFVIDPLGHVMMRFPPNNTLDFQSLRKDISRLLWASNIG